MKHWHLISGNNNLAQIHPNPPIVANRKVRSQKDSLVKGQLPAPKLHTSILEVIHDKFLR